MRNGVILIVMVVSLVICIVTSGCKKGNDNNPIEPTKVTASFTIDKATGDSPLLVKFTNTSTNAASYNWDFGDGTTSTEKDPSHSFTNTSTTNAKSFTVTLTTTAADNSTATSNTVITVNKSLPGAVFNPNLTYGTMTDQDGNVYKTITIGTQTWMAENLRATKYRNGDSIANVTDNTAWTALTTGAWCTYGNTANNDIIATYGRLYNWYAVNDSRNIVPQGWHVPTDAEWTTLTTYLGGLSVASGKIKEIGITHWSSPNTGATNESGFTALPSGDRDWYNNGTFLYLGGNCLYWSSTQVSADLVWSRVLDNNDANCNRYNSDKRNGFAVRLVKD